MNKYFINGVEVEEDEFYAEFKAQTHAFFDENFEEILIDYSENYDVEIRIGIYGFSVPQLFYILPEEMQNEIASELYNWYEEYSLDDLAYDEGMLFTVGSEEFHFEIKEVDEE